MRKVVVAVDGSEVSREVINYALHYDSKEKDVKLFFIHVIEVSEYEKVSFGNFSVNVPPGDDEVKMEFEKFIKEQISASGIGKPMEMSIHIATGSAYDKIVSFAEEKDADMIMIGHRGLSNLKRFFLGSVASKVVAHSPCSVYVHRQKSSGKKSSVLANDGKM